MPIGLLKHCQEAVSSKLRVSWRNTWAVTTEVVFFPLLRPCKDAPLIISQLGAAQIVLDSVVPFRLPAVWNVLVCAKQLSFSIIMHK